MPPYLILCAAPVWGLVTCSLYTLCYPQLGLTQVKGFYVLG